MLEDLFFKKGPALKVILDISFEPSLECRSKIRFSDIANLKKRGPILFAHAFLVKFLIFN